MNGPWRCLSCVRLVKHWGRECTVLFKSPRPRWFAADRLPAAEGQSGIGDFGERPSRTHFRWLSLAFVALVALKLATTYPAQRGARGMPDSPKDRDYVFYWQSQQMFRLDPDQLSPSQFRAVKRRCRLVTLAERYVQGGVTSLSDDDCREVVEALDDFGPMLRGHHGYLRLREGCLKRLGGPTQSGRGRSADQSAACSGE